MSVLQIYNSAKTGLNMKNIKNGVGFAAASDDVEYLDTYYFGGGTYYDLFRVFDSTIKYGALFYSFTSGGAILESLYYYDRKIDPVLSWYGANIFVAEEDLLSGSDFWFFSVLNGNDRIIGNGYRDLIKGGNGSDTLVGKGGNDTLVGERGNDKLRGDAGADTLKGGANNDTLNGGKGDDALRGNSGRDKFVFAKNFGRDTVLDFKDNVDTIVLNDNSWRGRKTVSEVLSEFGSMKNGDAVLDFGGGDVLVVANTRLSELQNDISIV